MLTGNVVLVEKEVHMGFNFWFVLLPLLVVVVAILAYKSVFLSSRRTLRERWPGLSSSAGFTCGIVAFILVWIESHAGLAQLLINHEIKLRGSFNSTTTGAGAFILMGAILYGLLVYFVARVARLAACGARLIEKEEFVVNVVLREEYTRIDDWREKRKNKPIDFRVGGEPVKNTGVIEVFTLREGVPG